MALDPQSTISMSTIKSRMLRPALTSHYICEFQPPNTGFINARINNTAEERLDKLSLACSEASLPGSSLMTNEINDDHTGVTERNVYRRAYDDRADFTFFIGAEDYYAIRMFEAWISYTMNEQYINRNQISANNYTYRAQFPDNYCTGGRNGGALSITKFERDHATTGKSLVYNFVRAFPISINSMPVSYDASDLLKCTVSFSYSRYWIEQLIDTTTTQTPEATRTPVTSTQSSISSIVSDLREIRLRTQNRIREQGGIPATQELIGPSAPL